MRIPISEIKKAHDELNAAHARGRSKDYCLRLWSKFIRARDQNRCVLCHARGRLSAHHIVRKSFWEHLRYQTGNGITLCHECHKEPHKKFNGRPNLNLPMDAEGGENIDLLTGLLNALIIDANHHKFKQDEFYFFDDRSLNVFKKIQGIPDKAMFSGSRLQQAYAIWNQTPRGMFEAILKSVGVTVPEDYIQTDLITFFESQMFKEADGKPSSVMYVRYVPPTPMKVDPEDD